MDRLAHDWSSWRRIEAEARKLSSAVLIGVCVVSEIYISSLKHSQHAASAVPPRLVNSGTMFKMRDAPSRWNRLSCSFDQSAFTPKRWVRGEFVCTHRPFPHSVSEELQLSGCLW
jgi:hypothetical protein